MKHRILGKTGIVTSILGFGAMRLPKVSRDSEEINQDESVRIIRKGIDNGINFVDTAYIYDGSEEVVGKALQNGYREKITLMTKCPTFNIKSQEDFDKFLNEELDRLKVDSIDIYLFHGLSVKRLEEIIEKYNLMKKVSKAKEEGKIKHIGFSSHDEPDNVIKIIDTGLFEIVLLQYNILDPSYEKAIELAAKNGLGVIVMGPNNGGRLAGEPSKDLQEFLTPKRKSFVDLAMKYVWSNENVHVALSGMESEEMVDENVSLATNELVTLTDDERNKTIKLKQKFNELTENRCTGCNYCLPCPNEVNISAIFAAQIDYEVYGQKENARLAYKNIGKPFWSQGKRVEACTECGECLEKCPQKIQIIEQLRSAHSILA